jgi:hypothetical protein
MSNAAPSNRSALAALSRPGGVRAMNLRDAKKEIGLGYDPGHYSDGGERCLAAQCSPQSRIVVAEVARWRVDSPVLDATIGSTFGNRIDVWGTKDGQPPAGVSTATNTLATPGLFATDMIIRGISIRILVEPESRLIGGMLYTPGTIAALPGFPDQWTQNDITNNALGLPEGIGTPTPAELLWGMSTWKNSYAFVNAYNLSVGKDFQEQLIREPLTQVAHIQPFAEAEAAGMVFGSNIDRINELNQRLQDLGETFQFAGQYFKRLGSLTVGGVNVSDFAPTREQDGAMTMWGGIGVPQNMLQHDPYLFTTPIFWPAGHPISIVFEANDQRYQQQFQRWLSLTGGNGGGEGNDLLLPFSNQVAANAGFTGLSPSATGANVMLEQTLDVATTPVAVTQQVETRRAIMKGGTQVFEVAVIGFRVGNPLWGPIVGRAIKSGAISAPNGLGALAGIMNQI